jgi:hypothetical protein
MAPFDPGCCRQIPALLHPGDRGDAFTDSSIITRRPDLALHLRAHQATPSASSWLYHWRDAERRCCLCVGDVLLMVVVMELLVR